MKYVGNFKLELEEQACALCGHASFTRLATNDRYLMGLITVGCDACGLVQTNPRPGPQAQNDFYRLHYRRFYQNTRRPDQEYVASLHKDVRLRYTADYFVSQLRLAPESTVLDFGCGEGSLFAAMRQAGLSGDFYGVELNAEFGEYASEVGNATVFNEMRCSKPVDLVVINHVLEHLLDPVGTLRRLASLLSPGGRIYIDVPDVEEYGTINDLHIAHLTHFSTRTLHRVAIAAGLAVHSVEKHAPPHHPASVRLVAGPGSAIQVPEFSAADEKRAWEAVSSAGRFRNTVRLHLARIGLLRTAYRSARRLLPARR